MISGGDMRYRLGRIGAAEAACAAGISLCVNGLFDIDQKRAYAFGNSTYIWLPLAALVSLAVFLLASAAMEKRGSENLADLFFGAFGRPLGIIASLTVCVSLLICASVPLGNFTHVLDDLVYEGVEYPKLFAFLIPAAGFIAFRGLETIGRLSRLYVCVLIAALSAAFLSSFKSQMGYRMYPIAGDGAAHLLGCAASGGVFFLPPLAALLVFGEGLQGAEHARKAGKRAALIAAAVCLAVQLMLARLYTYEGLSQVFMPLCRVNYPGIERSYVMWLDKLLVMAWINGALISSGYCIYSAALLYARAFGQRDVTPAALLMTAIVCVTVLAEFESDISSASLLLEYSLKYGVLLAAAPMLSASLIALMKRNNAGAGYERISANE